MLGPVAVPPLDGFDDVMVLAQSRSWFDAFCADDTDEVVAILTATTAKERDLLLNGLFDYRLVGRLKISLCPTCCHCRVYLDNKRTQCMYFFKSIGLFN